MTTAGIYGLRNTANDKWYIGYSNNIIKRWDRAYQRLGCKRQPKIYAALKKYGYDAFEKVILEECSTDKAIWGPRETYWINHHNSIEDGYNIAKGGTGGNTREGIPCSEETKRKISASKIGRVGTNVGVKWSEEQRKKMVERLTGRKLSKEHIEKLKSARPKGIESEFADKNIYTFTNLKTHETFRGFRCDFLKSHPSLGSSGLSCVVLGKWKHYRNWKVTVAS